jgi:hypothetical protein
MPLPRVQTSVPMSSWALTHKASPMQRRLLEAGARYVIFQMAEVAVPRELFQKILRLIDDLRPKPAPSVAQRHTSKKREPLRPSKTWGSLVATLQRKPSLDILSGESHLQRQPGTSKDRSMSTHRKRPRDPAQLAKLMVDIATGQIEDRPPTPEEQDKDPSAIERGRCPSRNSPRICCGKLSSHIPVRSASAPPCTARLCPASSSFRADRSARSKG